MLNVLEKLMWVVTALVILAVVGLAVLGPKSAVRDEDWKWEFEQLNAAARRRPEVALPNTRARRFGPRSLPSARGEAGAERQPRRAADSSTDISPYADPAAAGSSPAARLQQGGRYVNGVYHAPPVYLPSSMRRKYSSFQDLVDLGQTAASVATQVDGQDAVQLEWIDERSPIASHLGLQPGDIIVSVNGRPASREQARQLYEELKNERDFEVLIIRNGQRMTLHYSVR